MVESNKCRRLDIDILKGFGLLLVIINHVGFGAHLYHYSYAFHMPLFFIVSGYLWKDRNESIFDRAKRKAKSLVLPYLIYGAIFVLYDIGIIIRNDNLVDVWMPLKRFLLYPTIGIPNGGPLWFLLCMFLVDLFFTVLTRGKHDYVKICIMIVLISLIGFIYPVIDGMPELPWTLEPAMVALLFFSFGNVLRRYEKKVGNILHISKWRLFFTGIMWIAMSYFNVTVDMKTSRYGNPFLFIFAGAFGTIFWWNVAIRLTEVKKNRTAEILKRALVYLSVNSITFLCMNRFLINRFNEWLNVEMFETMIVHKILIKIFILFFTVLGCIIIQLIVAQISKREWH